MTTPEYQKLAKDFLDLWQKQMSSVVRDKQFVEAMLMMMQNAQNAYGNATKPASSADPSRSAHADDGNLAQLAFRLGMCEQRLATLEEQAGKPKAKRADGAKQRRSAGSKKPRK